MARARQFKRVKEMQPVPVRKFIYMQTARGHPGLYNNKSELAGVCRNTSEVLDKSCLNDQPINTYLKVDTIAIYFLFNGYSW